MVENSNLKDERHTLKSELKYMEHRKSYQDKVNKTEEDKMQMTMKSN